jgi:hypothetical protein
MPFIFFRASIHPSNAMNGCYMAGHSFKIYIFHIKLTYIVDNPLTVFYSIFMAIWTVLFIEKWKRKNIILQYEWDVIDFEKKMERMRVEYELLSNLPKKKNPLTDVKKNTQPN